MPFWTLFAQAQVPQHMVLIDRLARTPISKIVILAAVLTLVRVVLFPYLQKTLKHHRGGAFQVAKFVNEAADAILYSAVVVFMLVRPFGIQTFNIPSGSMIDTLLVNDFIVGNKWVYRVSDPQPGDIVVFKPPVYAKASAQDSDVDYIKRLVGVPGDLIEIKGNKLYRNGKAIDEPYWTFTSTDPMTYGQKVLPKSEWGTVDIGNFKLVEHKGRIVPVRYDDTTANNPLSSVQVAEEFMAVDDAESEELRTAPAVKIPAGQYLFVGDNRNGSFDGRLWGLVPRDQIVAKAWVLWLPISRWKRLDTPPQSATIR